MPPQMMAHYVPQMIDQMINEKAMIYQASRMGLQVTEAETAKAIREQMPHLFPNGTFVGKDAYAAALAQQDMSISEFEDYMQEQILLNDPGASLYLLESLAKDGWPASRVHSGTVRREPLG